MRNIHVELVLFDEDVCPQCVSTVAQLVEVNSVNNSNFQPLYGCSQIETAWRCGDARTGI
jgi:hypothetical protein